MFTRFSTHYASEFADITENLLKPSANFNLAQVLNDASIRPYFRSLSVRPLPLTHYTK